MKKRKDRREEPPGTMSYQIGSKLLPSFWLLIGARKLLCFSAQSEDRTVATVWNWSAKTLSPGALLADLFFSSCHIFKRFALKSIGATYICIFLLFFFFHFPARLDFPSPPLYAPGSPRMWLIVLSCKTILDVQATISLTNDRFDGNRHRPLYPYRGSNVYVSLCHDEVLHYLSFPVLCAQGLSLHCRTLLKFMNVPTRREHTKVQESAPFASEPVLFVSGNTLSVNIGYVC